MTGEALPGRPGNLTTEQEEKLKELWITAFQLFGNLSESTSTTTDSEAARSKQDAVTSKKSAKKRMSFFRKSKEDSDNTSAANDVDDKFGQMNVYNEALANMTPQALRDTMWSMVKHDNPDALLLRFLRARQWNVEKALVMIISTMRWRLKDVHVDDELVKNGELKAFDDSKSTDPETQKSGKDFLEQMRLGKSFLHGTDKNGRPLCIVRVRFHKTGEQGEGSLEKYTVYLIETARMILAPPVDTASVLFDMTGFSMANMDYAPVKFMIKCFEANYPECLGVIIVHKAPWVFQGIWKIIRGWLDPVVASKVHFTNSVEEMEEFVDRSKIIKEIGGDEDWEYKYVEPVPGENDMMKETETRDKLLCEREEIAKEFEKITQEWINARDAESSSINIKRQEVANSLRDNYWKLDPYIRARSYYDRVGIISAGGRIQHYPTENTS
ncbi:Bgt-4258 [Blumeria graminis f. sp. tritici]|uniref:Bgt-4258 n=2 Tax=Blumeria graminis f. sp. tritici TaxID=62690 RepID=A0A061HP11_BLUGR|nr:Phosphatidylinositol transfer protein [Blumeria graminis f. sp. tritici 96224]VCU40058.1 Bgt-4258 [Blumeria graminis f. sp. tritici]